MLHRYWFEFDLRESQARMLNCGVGCGVTAYGYEDALTLLKEIIFKDGELPPIVNFVEDIDLSTLDDNHVRPSMGIPFFRGVWFPARPSKSR